MILLVFVWLYGKRSHFQFYVFYSDVFSNLRHSSGSIVSNDA